MPLAGSTLLGGYADVRLDAGGNVLNPYVNYNLGSLLVNNIVIDPFAIGGIDVSDFARLSMPNVFQRENTLSGIRLGQIKIIDFAQSGYEIQPTDFIILIDATAGDTNVVLPLSDGNGQYFYTCKIDMTGHVASVLTQGPDVIFPDAISMNFVDPGDDGFLLNALPEVWLNPGPTLAGLLTLPLFLEKSRLMEDGAFLLFNPDMNTFHAIRIRGADNDSLYMEIDAGIP